MNRKDMLASALEVLGFGLLTVGCGLLAVWLAFVVAGLGCVAVAAVLSVPGRDG